MTLLDKIRGLPADRLVLSAGLLAVVELFLLRILTRTFVHIPGLERLQRPLSVLFEAGRIAYYATVITVVVTLLALTALAFSSGPSSRRWLLGLPVSVFLLTAMGARLGAIGPVTAAWVAMGCAVMLAISAPSMRRLIVVGVYAAASVALAASSGLQGQGGGLTPTQVEAFSTAGEILLVMAGLSTLLIVGRRPRRGELLLGLGAGVLGILLLTFSRSTVLILTLWAFGLGGHLPVIAYGAAFAALMITVLATARTEPATAGGILLLFSAGAGMISTYQSALGVAGIAALVYFQHGLRRGSTSEATLPIAAGV